MKELLRLLAPSWKNLEAGVAGADVVGVLLLEVTLLPLLAVQVASHADHLLPVPEMQRQRTCGLIRDVVRLPWR